MELNGVSNIKMMVQRAIEENTESHTNLSPELADKILDQLDLLNRYMVAVGDTLQYNDAALCEHTQPMEIPYWHQIREDKEAFPTLAEKQIAIRKCAIQTVTAGSD